MHLRLATFDDCSDIAQIGIHAFESEQVFGWLYPLRQSNPNAFEATFYHQAVARSLKPRWVTVVAVGDESDRWCNGEIVGFAVWFREGTDAGAQTWNQDPMSQKLRRWLWMAQNKLELVAGWYTLASDQSRLDQLHDIVEKLYLHMPNRWYLDTLGVNPQYQRKGIGRKLLDWGIERANAENVPIALEATLYGEHLYRRAGFFDYDRVDLTSTIGMPSMVFPAPGKTIEEYITMKDH